MKLGFTTLALFMEPNNDIIDLAKKHGFEIVEILGEDPFYEKDHGEFKDCGLDMRIHAATVDINIASLNKGIRAESVKQMIQCGQYAESINANTITVHPGIIGRNELDEMSAIYSDYTVFATGGIGGLYEQSTNYPNYNPLNG